MENKIRVQIYRNTNYFIEIPLWLQNSHISRIYSVFDICVKTEALSARFEHRCHKILEFPLRPLLYAVG